MVLSSMSLILMAFQCEDDPCSVATFSGYKIAVENNNASYTLNDTFYLTATTPLQLTDYCNNEQTGVFINEPERFFDGFFFIKLKEPTDQPLPYNGDIARNNFDLVIEKGDAYDRGFCETNELFELLPILNSDQSLFEYRLAVTPRVPGDYAITIAYYGTFSEITDTHLNILDPYSDSATLRFTGCSDSTHERSLGDETYYFSVTE